MKKIVKRAQVVLGLVWESVQFAMSSLRAEKFRTLLSLLGITIGIFSIVLVLSLVDGLNSNIRRGLSSLGGETITLQREPWEADPDQGWDWWEYIQRPPVKYDDYLHLRENADYAGAITFFTTFSRDISAGRELSRSANIVAVAPGFGQIFDVAPLQGRWLTPWELESDKGLCYLGANVASELFPDGDPIGKVVKVGRFDATVVGVAAPQGESIAQIFDMDRSVFLPVGFGARMSNISSGGAVALIPASGVTQDNLASQVRVLTRGHRGLAPGERDNFSINRMSYLSATVDDLFRKINLVGWIIGGFALLVGGFGIANIIYVSVRERMPQIGIQKALGAKNYLILIQFLAEGGVLSLLGGALGILIVLIISLILGDNSSVPVVLTAAGVLEGMAVALVVGVLSSVLPARWAAKMDPVKAINM